MVLVGQAIDDRGKFQFINEFEGFIPKRIYIVENFSKDTIRAFHKNHGEDKIFICVRGAVKFVKAVETPEIFIVKEGSSIKIEAEVWNGWKALTDDTILLGISNAELKDRSDERLPPHSFCDHKKGFNPDGSMTADEILMLYDNCIWRTKDR